MVEYMKEGNYVVLCNESLGNLMVEISERNIEKNYNLISMYYGRDRRGGIKYHFAILKKRIIDEYL